VGALPFFGKRTFAAHSERTGDKCIIVGVSDSKNCRGRAGSAANATSPSAFVAQRSTLSVRETTLFQAEMFEAKLW
jgi:hypothetical protein